MTIFSNRKKLIITLAGIGVGILAGLAYWKFVGCQTGSCSITANWHTSALFGGIFGYLLADSIKLDKKGAEEKNSNVSKS